MGVFNVQLRGAKSKQVISEFELPNFLAKESYLVALRRVFGSQSPLSFTAGLAGCNAGVLRPNPPLDGNEYPAVVADFNNLMTLDDVTDVHSEGGAFDDHMRSIIGYAPQSMSFSMDSHGTVTSNTIQWTNDVQWTPQYAGAWDSPCTEVVENAPAEWNDYWRPYMPEVKFPWYRPRKRCWTYECEDSDGVTHCLEAYFHHGPGCETSPYDHLCNLYRFGMFPISSLYVAAAGGLFAAARLPVISDDTTERKILIQWWPELSIYVQYQARIFNTLHQITEQFRKRFTSLLFNCGGYSNYAKIAVRPVKSNCPPFNTNMTFSDISDHFHPDVGWVVIPAWTISTTGPNVEDYPYAISSGVPEWTNNTAIEQGPFSQLAVCGCLANCNNLNEATWELMWMTPLDNEITLELGDKLRIEPGVRFDFKDFG